MTSARQKLTEGCLSFPLIMGLMFMPSEAGAGDLEVTVKDTGGSPVQNAIAYATPASGKVPAAGESVTITVVQKNMKYHPLVSAIRVGTSVSFPNKDTVSHHVYSFSKAKKFEIPLYKGNPPNPIIFDKPGVVTLGCNIHDWMRAYVFVLDTPYYSASGKDGKATLSGLPGGDYKVKVWHPRIKRSSAKVSQDAAVNGSGQAAFSIKMKPQ